MKKNYKEIEKDYINLKQQVDGAVNFSVSRNLIQQFCEEGKLNIDALESLYIIFIDNIDSLY